jgi:hypothetical protein
MEKKGIVSEIATGLPAWAKGIIAVGVVGGIGFAIYKLTQKGGALLKPDEAKKDVKKLEEIGQQPTYMEAQYVGFADAIYAARGCNNVFGTNEDAMYNVFRKMVNDLDVAKLIEKFGKRRLCFSFTEGNLGGFLNDDLDQDEIAIINNILKSKGIKYQF